MWGSNLVCGRPVRKSVEELLKEDCLTKANIHGTVDDVTFSDVTVGARTEPTKVAVWPFLGGQRVAQICASGDRAFFLMHNGDLYEWDNLCAENDEEASEESSVQQANASGAASVSRARSRLLRGGAENDPEHIVPRLVPVQSMMLKRALKPAWKAISIACGPRHVLCTTDIGQVFSWGTGADGRLGHGTTETLSQPRLIMALADQQIWQVACGNAHSVCISIDGSLYTWGRGANGRLGHGTQQDVHIPQQLEISALNVKSTSKLGRDRSSSSSSVSSAASSASNTSKRKGTLTKQGSSGALRDRLRLQQIHAVACGWNFTTVVTTAGDVYCMGRGTEGQCGSQSVVDRFTPHVVETLRGKHFHVTAVACGCRHTLALCRGGDVFSWGLGEQGQLGSGAAYTPLPEIVKFPQATRTPTTSPMATSSNHKVPLASQLHGTRIDHDCVSEVACGPWHSVAITAKGRVFVWGMNDKAQLGVGDHRDRGKPTLIRRLPPNLNVGHVTCIASATLLLERQSYKAHDETKSEQNGSDSADNTANNGGGGKGVPIPRQRAKTAKVDAWRDMVRPSALKYASPREQHFYNVDHLDTARSSHQPTAKGRNASQRSVSAGGKLLTHTRYSTAAFETLTTKLRHQEVKCIVQWAIDCLDALYLCSQFSVLVLKVELQLLTKLWKEIVLPNWNRIWMALVQHQGIRQLRVAALSKTIAAVSVFAAGKGKDSANIIITKLKGGDKEQDKFDAAALASIFEESHPPTTGRMRARSRSRSSSTASVSSVVSVAHQQEDMQRRVILLNVTSLWQKGIPATMRSWVWPQLIGNSLRITPSVFLNARRRVRRVWQFLNAENGKPGDKTNKTHALRGREKTIALIETDLPRTLPYLRLFGKGEALHATVRAALEAFVCHRPEIGYIQGLSYIAAILSLFMRARQVKEFAGSVSYSSVFSLHDSSEFKACTQSIGSHSDDKSAAANADGASCHTEFLEDTYLVFQCLVNLMIGTRTPARLFASSGHSATRHQEVTGLAGCSHLHDFFLMNTGTMEHYYDVFDLILNECEPKLCAHFKTLGVNYEIFLFMWLQTVFLRVLPLETSARVWDLFLLGGTPVLFRTAVAILRHMKQQLLRSNFEQCLGHLTAGNKSVWAAFAVPDVLIPNIAKVRLSNRVLGVLNAVGRGAVFMRPSSDAKAQRLGFSRGNVSDANSVKQLYEELSATAPQQHARELRRLLENLPLVG